MRGRLMRQACENTRGTMVALIGGIFDDVLEICDKSGVEIANINCPGQIVISGERDAIEKAIEIASKMSFKRIVSLKVAGAYHSKLMAEASVAFEKFLHGTEFRDPSVRIISNVTANFVESGQSAKSLLVKQIISPVLFEKCCERAIRSGIDRFFECGAGRVLSGLLKRTCPSAMAVSLDGMADFNL
jgi:[acyl-carrier-protein] S-malonyltransferase